MTNMKEVLKTLLRIFLMLLVFCSTIIATEIFKQKSCLTTLLYAAFFGCCYFLFYTPTFEKLSIMSISSAALEFFSIKYWKDVIAALSWFHVPAIETRLLVDNALYSLLIQLTAFLCVAFYTSQKSKRELKLHFQSVEMREEE